MPAAQQPLLVLYGTQTGNSRAMAKELGEEAAGHGFAARVLSMDQFKTLDFEQTPLLVIITATTGNGDAPDNADKFLRYVKRKTTPSVFAKTRYAIFGLGDSNYELFCEVPKQFDQHIMRLGGTRMLKRCDADEVEGLETFFAPWKDELWTTLKSLDDGGVAAEPVAAAAEPPASQTGAAPPKEEEEVPDGLGGSADRPLMAPVVAARWLTTSDDDEPAGEARRVLHLELDVSGGGGAMRFEAGDAIAVVRREV